VLQITKITKEYNISQLNIYFSYIYKYIQKNQHFTFTFLIYETEYQTNMSKSSHVNNHMTDVLHEIRAFNFV